MVATISPLRLIYISSPTHFSRRGDHSRPKGCKHSFPLEVTWIQYLPKKTAFSEASNVGEIQ